METAVVKGDNLEVNPLMSRRAWRRLRCVGLVAVWLGVVIGAPVGLAHDEDVGTVRNFGPNLQQAAGGVCRQPEGLTIDPRGNLYAASNSDSAVIGHICVIDPRGALVDIIEVPTGTSPAIGLLGELWEGDHLFVLDQADNVVPNGRMLKVTPRTHAVTLVTNGFAFPNALTENRQGAFFVSDSLLGRIYKVLANGSKSVWIDSPLLRSTNPNQPVGANGVAFDEDERFLYVANTGDRRVLRVAVERDGEADRIEVFADGASIDRRMGLAGPVALFGADGIQFDVKGNLYVMANQANEIQVLSPLAKLIHRYAGKGANALDFNASLVFDDRDLFITNMSAADGGVNSKLSVFEAPAPGLRLR
jgi:sugar lactone lactonase YvrE